MVTSLVIPPFAQFLFVCTGAALKMKEGVPKSMSLEILLMPPCIASSLLGTKKDGNCSPHKACICPMQCAGNWRNQQGMMGSYVYLKSHVLQEGIFWLIIGKSLER